MKIEFSGAHGSELFISAISCANLINFVGLGFESFSLSFQKLLYGFTGSPSTLMLTLLTFILPNSSWNASLRGSFWKANGSSEAIFYSLPSNFYSTRLLISTIFSAIFWGLFAYLFYSSYTDFDFFKIGSSGSMQSKNTYAYSEAFFNKTYNDSFCRGS